MQTAEKYLVRYLKPTKDLETFDDLRLAAFNSNSLKMDFEKNFLHVSQCKKAYSKDIILSTAAMDTSPT